MNKKDLKPGMVVELRDKSKWLYSNVSPNKEPEEDFEGTLIDLKGRFVFIRLNNYNDKLKLTFLPFPNYDIMKIYSDYTLSKLIWERPGRPGRPELPKLTDKEKTFLKLIIPKWKYLARDEDGELCAFERKPIRCKNSWNNSSGGAYDIIESNILNIAFSFITWEDSEPYNIAELLLENN